MILNTHFFFRDGSAVELIGLSCSTFKWLAKLHDSGHYPYSGVKAEVDGKFGLTDLGTSVVMADVALKAEVKEKRICKVLSF